MGSKYLLPSIFLQLLLSLSLSLSLSTNQLVLATPTSDELTSRQNREAIEIIGGGGGVVIGGGDGGITIGIGGGSPSATPANCPPPPPPPSCSPPAPSRLELAREVLLEFKTRVEHDPYGVLQTWTGPNPCKYKGILCAINPKYNQTAVYSIQFNGFRFAGRNLGIYNFIEKLPDVSIFHANSNGFSGSIPESINKLPYLFELDLSNNNYQGGFPNAVLGATQLTFLDLRFNCFSGRVPPQLFNLQLLALFINNNGFQQELPSNLGATPVAFLTLANNRFFGPIPKSIGQAGNSLLEVLFLNNELTGCLPCEIGKLKKARVFDAEGNYLTGPIPHSFACLENIQFLILARNQLSGPVPEAVCKLPKLGNLTLSNNYLTEVGPECMKLVRNKVLDVRMNCVLGLPNQRSPEECKRFYNKPMACPEAHLYTQIPCKGSASYLTKEVSMDDPPQSHPHPTLSYSTLVPASN